MLAGAYAGWAGSLPPEVVEQRLQQALKLADLEPTELVRDVVPTLFSESATADLVREFAASMTEFHPAGLRTMARDFAAADLRDVLPRIDVPTLLLYGDQDVRAPTGCGRKPSSRYPTSRLVVLPGVGHVSSVEAAESFNAEVRAFLRSVLR